VVHKAARECPITEPHPPHMCGIVKARQQAQAGADEISGHARKAPSD
jgi:hypothetical protein